VVMSHLESHDWSAADIARRTNVSAQSVGESVNALVEKNFVSRRNDPNNPRIYRLSFTPKGKKSLKIIDKKVDAFESALFEEFSDSELESFRKSVDKLIIKFRSGFFPV
jgi:DNA-binding MarR family transcriptional regulator